MIELRMKWQNTWPDSIDDFAAIDPVYGPVGRINPIVGGFEKGRWSWAMFAHGYGIRSPVPCSGIEKTPREAAAKVEECWLGARQDASKSGRLVLPRSSH